MDESLLFCRLDAPANSRPLQKHAHPASMAGKADGSERSDPHECMVFTGKTISHRVTEKDRLPATLPGGLPISTFADMDAQPYARAVSRRKILAATRNLSPGAARVSESEECIVPSLMA
jgi:hypothetical protein